MGIHLPKRVHNGGVTDDLQTTDLLAVYTIEYEGLSMENFGIAMVSLLTALPDDRVWKKPMIYQNGDTGVIYVEGLKKKVFEEAKE